MTAATNDESPLVQVHAMRVLAERQEWNMAQRKLAEEGLKNRDAFVQRNAAEALGAHPHEAGLQPLLDLSLQFVHNLCPRWPHSL